MPPESSGHRWDIVHDGDWDRSKFDVEDFAMGVIRFTDDLTVNLEQHGPIIIKIWKAPSSWGTRLEPPIDRCESTPIEMVR